MTTARQAALDALLRIDDGAYANLVLPGLLGGLSDPDRRFATELVYGTTRMQRACDWLVDRFIARPPDRVTRAVLRLGAYQLRFLGTPPHAAVDSTVELAPRRTRGLVNAVLRKVAAGEVPAWPSEGVRLSYPDWVIEALSSSLGTAGAVEALEAMNVAASATVRADGYVQDLASQWVTELVEVQPGERVADVCAAPGGKCTLMAAGGPALVVAGDVRASRVGLVAANVARVGAGAIAVVAADGCAPPLRAGSMDRVLVDAPCSGLGVLRRRPDARWRIEPSDVVDLVALQRRLLTAAVGLLRPGGVLVYSVCTLTDEETVGIDGWLDPALEPLELPGAPWVAVGARGARLLPQAAGTDGMYLLRVRVPTLAGR